MISLSAMSSSEFSRLKDDLKRGAVRLQFLKAVNRFLKAHPMDGGADSDLVYMVGESLASVNVWERISPKMIAEYVSYDNSASLEVLLETVPDYLEVVLKELDRAHERTRSFYRSHMAIISPEGRTTGERIDRGGHVVEAISDPIISHLPRIKADLNQAWAFYKGLDHVSGSNLKTGISLRHAVKLEVLPQAVYRFEHEPKIGFAWTNLEPRNPAAEKKRPKAHPSKNK
ncbi:hypothetical protein ACQZ5N_25860 [Agrobacterium sp. 22-221-1]